MFFVNPQNNNLSDILYAKVCRNEQYLFWTVWEKLDPYNEEYLSLGDLYFIEAYGLKWRIMDTNGGMNDERRTCTFFTWKSYRL